MAKQFTASNKPATAAQNLLFTDTYLGNKTRTHDYRRWSDRATVVSYQSSTDTYTIALTAGANETSGDKIFYNVRSILPADVRRLDPGTTVAIGYLQERREQPVILGVGTVRKKITEETTTPLSTIVQFDNGGGLTLVSDSYDLNTQSGDRSTSTILGVDPTSLGAGGCTRHVHAVGGVGQISWDWSYDGADRILDISGQNDFRLTFGVEGGGGGNGAARRSNVVTLTTLTAHGFSVGQNISVSGMGSFDGEFVVVSVPTTTTLTYAQTAADASDGGGTVRSFTPYTSAILRKVCILVIYTNMPVYGPTYQAKEGVYGGFYLTGSGQLICPGNTPNFCRWCFADPFVVTYTPGAFSGCDCTGLPTTTCGAPAGFCNTAVAGSCLNHYFMSGINYGDYQGVYDYAIAQGAYTDTAHVETFNCNYGDPVDVADTTAACTNANGSTLTATDAAGNMATAVISAS